MVSNYLESYYDSNLAWLDVNGRWSNTVGGRMRGEISQEVKIFKRLKENSITVLVD